jgi:hypothetical protein
MGINLEKRTCCDLISNLLSPSSLSPSLAITSIDLREINNEPYYWINKTALSCKNREFKIGVSKEKQLLLPIKYCFGNYY